MYRYTISVALNVSALGTAYYVERSLRPTCTTISNVINALGSVCYYTCFLFYKQCGCGEIEETKNDENSIFHDEEAWRTEATPSQYIVDGTRIELKVEDIG